MNQLLLVDVFTELVIVANISLLRLTGQLMFIGILNLNNALFFTVFHAETKHVSNVITLLITSWMILQKSVSYALSAIACNVLLYRFAEIVMNLLDTFSTVLQESVSYVSMKDVYLATVLISVPYVTQITISLKTMPANYVSHAR